jgi:hypothetical protein
MERIFAVIGAMSALVGLVTVIVAGVQHLKSSSQGRHAEERMVGRLAPGHGLKRLAEIIGSTADRELRLRSGNTLAQYERQWETIQLLADPAGAVISGGVYAKKPDFHPKIIVGRSKLILGRTRMGGVSLGQPPSAAGAYCGAHQAGYFEEYEDVSIGDGGDSVVVGLSDVHSSGIDVADACSLAQLPRCSPPLDNAGGNVMSASYESCLRRSSAAQDLRNAMPISVVIITPLQKITPDMLHLPDNVIGF